MPEQKKTTLKAHVDEAISKRPDLEVIAIADGAKDNWTFLARAFPKAIKILDFYHAADHLKNAINCIYPNEKQAHSVFESQRSILRHNDHGIDQVIEWLKAHYALKPDDTLLCELNYFKSNRDRCRYETHAKAHRPIGSGVVEAACKSIVTKRLKCSGMAWRWQGGQAILNFRAYLKSQLFDELWVALEATFKRPVLA